VVSSIGSGVRFEAGRRPWITHNMYFSPHDVNVSAEAIHENATRI
jgi:hypothetical protein